jgi:hypothetical protein
MEAAAAAACGGGGGEGRGAWARQGGDRERQGGFTPKPTVESGVVSTACAGFPLRAHARREHLGLLHLYTSVGMGVMVLYGCSLVDDLRASIFFKFGGSVVMFF